MPVLTTPCTTPSLLSSAASSTLALLSSGSSASSIPFADSQAEPVTEMGLPHAEITLSARKYKSHFFIKSLLDTIHLLKIPTWNTVSPNAVQVFKVSGSLTNAVFFVSCPSIPRISTVLLRIYGSSSASLISRPRELHILHILSSKYHIGPRIYGTFSNGRLEEYFDSKALTASDMRDPVISRWIGARMAELHCVDLDIVETDNLERDISVKNNVTAWLTPAQEVLDLSVLPAAALQELDLGRFRKYWDVYLRWLSDKDDEKLGNKRVFAHNDAQCGNLLRLAHPSIGLDEHREIIVVDFEYASKNPAAFDIANHFHEWTADYHGETPHLLQAAHYPTPEQRRNFILSYLHHIEIDNEDRLSTADHDAEAAAMDYQVRCWSPASHAMWAIWGIVQAREHLITPRIEPEFDYIGYALGRMEGFYRELGAFSICLDVKKD